LYDCEKTECGEKLSMTKQEEKYNEKEMKLIGMTFMAFLMGLGVICGVWFLVNMVELLPKFLG
jgi:hypothetical protein